MEAEEKLKIEKIINSDIECFNPNILSSIMQLMKRRDVVVKAYKKEVLNRVNCILEIRFLNEQIKQLLGL